MLTEKECYMCKYLLFFDSKSCEGYYCTLRNAKLDIHHPDFSCINYSEEQEE